MNKHFLILVLGLLLAMPFVLRAEEIEILLMEVTQMGSLVPGDEPLDGNDHLGDTPTRPNDFRTTINGNTLSITKLNEAIPFAHAIVTKVVNGNIVLNRHFVDSLTEQISSPGFYILTIQCNAGTFEGQFMIH